MGPVLRDTAVFQPEQNSYILTVCLARETLVKLHTVCTLDVPGCNLQSRGLDTDFGHCSMAIWQSLDYDWFKLFPVSSTMLLCHVASSTCTSPLERAARGSESQPRARPAHGISGESARSRMHRERTSLLPHSGRSPPRYCYAKPSGTVKGASRVVAHLVDFDYATRLVHRTQTRVHDLFRVHVSI